METVPGKVPFSHQAAGSSSNLSLLYGGKQVGDNQLLINAAE